MDIVQQLRSFVKEYDEAYPLRLADMHQSDCICLRCQRDLNEATANSIEALRAEVKHMRDALEKIAAKEGNVICMSVTNRTFTSDGIASTQMACGRAEIARKALSKEK